MNMQTATTQTHAFSNTVNADHIMASIMEHVQTEIGYYRELLQTMEQERDILLKGLHEQLMPNCERKLQLGEQLAAVQTKRQEMVNAFSTEDFTVSKLSELLPLVSEADRENFRQCLLEADNLSRRMRELNELNRSYINEALDTIGQILSIFAGQQSAGYTASGGRAPLKGRRLLAREV